MEGGRSEVRESESEIESERQSKEQRSVQDDTRRN